MKIKKIIIENIRCFEHIEIDLTNDSEANDWTVFLGNNGVGKTTVMRCIALGLCEESGAAGLLDDLDGNWIREEAGKKPAKIRIEFDSLTGYKEAPSIETKIEWTEYNEIKLTQSVKPDTPKIWENIFLCAYGANRRSYGSTSFSEYTTTDAVYSLFDYKTQMQNPELILRRLKDEVDIEPLFRKLEDILLLDKNAIQLTRTGIYINGPWGSYKPFGVLGDGYQATLAWIMDLYGWKMMNEELMRDTEITGIVLVDEIEQHLHPVWQREIIGRLFNQFKNIQFIATTHSPIVALNTLKTRKKDPKSKLFVFDWIGNSTADVSEIKEPLIDLDYNQLLASEAFGHLYNQNTKVDKILKEMSQLASIDNPTQSQNTALKRIKLELKNLMFPEGGSLIERIVEREYYKEIEEKADYYKQLLKEANDKN